MGICPAEKRSVVLFFRRNFTLLFRNFFFSSWRTQLNFLPVAKNSSSLEGAFPRRVPPPLFPTCNYFLSTSPLRASHKSPPIPFFHDNAVFPLSLRSKRRAPLPRRHAHFSLLTCNSLISRPLFFRLFVKLWPGDSHPFFFSVRPRDVFPSGLFCFRCVVQLLIFFLVMPLAFNFPPTN